MNREDLIDTLIEIRMGLAKKEGVEDWKNDSQGDCMGSLSSRFIQELIWYIDGDRDMWSDKELNVELMKVIILNLSEWMNTPNEDLENMMGISWMQFNNLVRQIREGEEE
tara:strand:- start:243 stop:572 length:330 start_codon:yes stop_codon:yes gene_type:complete